MELSPLKKITSKKHKEGAKNSKLSCWPLDLLRSALFQAEPSVCFRHLAEAHCGVSLLGSLVQENNAEKITHSFQSLLQKTGSTDNRR